MRPGRARRGTCFPLISYFWIKFSTSLCNSSIMTANASVNINYWRWTVPPPPDTAPPALSPPQPSIPGYENLPEVQDLNQTELLREDVSQLNKCDFSPQRADRSRSSSIESREFMSCERNHPPNIRNLLMSISASCLKWKTF